MLCFDQRGETQFLLISEMPGASAADLVTATAANAEGVVRQLGVALRALHAVDISACPFDRRLDVKLSQAKARVDLQLVDEEDFEGADAGRSALEIYHELVATRPGDEELVFTHGNYCFPNIMLGAGGVTGFIDLGRAGVADKYTDLALAVRSIRQNTCDEQLVRAFLDAYGLREVNWRKIDYYTLLDELF